MYVFYQQQNFLLTAKLFYLRLFTFLTLYSLIILMEHKTARCLI